MKYSGFTFTHNCLTGGYPIREAVQAVAPFVDEVVAVDMESTDGTHQLLESLGCRVIPGKWGTKAEMTLCNAYARHVECRHDNIIVFEADEVWDPALLDLATRTASLGGVHRNVAVHRIQVVENFQRARWYPHAVHRIIERGKANKDPNRGHTTKEHDSAFLLPPDYGLIWDVTNCFRDNYRARVAQNYELWADAPNNRRVPEHYLDPIGQMDEAVYQAFLAEPHWTWTQSPFALPAILKPLVGVTKYA